MVVTGGSKVINTTSQVNVRYWLEDLLHGSFFRRLTDLRNDLRTNSYIAFSLLTVLTTTFVHVAREVERFMFKAAR